jgi:4-hydroxybenzoate polyprenyltransferase
MKPKLSGCIQLFRPELPFAAGDAKDMEGDRKRGSKSIAIRMGKRIALRISSFIFVLVVLNSIIPYALGWLGSVYLILVSVMDLAVLYFTRSPQIRMACCACSQHPTSPIFLRKYRKSYV